MWNITANGDGCVAGTIWQDFRFTVVPDIPFPIIIEGMASGDAIVLAYDMDDTGYMEGIFPYQMFFYSLNTRTWTSLKQNVQVINGQGVVDLGVNVSNGYLYIRPITTPESDFIELYIK